MLFRWNPPWDAWSPLERRIWGGHIVPAPVPVGRSAIHTRGKKSTWPWLILRSRNIYSEKWISKSNFFTFKPFKSQFPVNMENLPVNNGNGQAYGYTLYETTIIRGGSLKSGHNIQDRALVSADKQSSCAAVYEYASALIRIFPLGFCEPKFHWHFSPQKCRISCSWWKGMILSFTSLYLIFVLLTLSWSIKKHYFIIVRSCNYIYPIFYLLI